MQMLKTRWGRQSPAGMFTLGTIVLCLISDINRLATMPPCIFTPLPAVPVRYAAAFETLTGPGGEQIRLKNLGQSAEPDSDLYSAPPHPSSVIEAEFSGLRVWNAANCWSVAPEEPGARILSQLEFCPPGESESHQFFARVRAGDSEPVRSIRLGTVSPEEKRTVSDSPIWRWIGGGIGPELYIRPDRDAQGTAGLSLTLPEPIARQVSDRTVAVEFYAIDWLGSARPVPSPQIDGDSVFLPDLSATGIRNIRVVALPYHWIEFRNLSLLREPSEESLPER